MRPHNKTGMQALTCKLLIKCRKDQVSVGVIVTTKKCVKRNSMIWAFYLLNQFLIDCVKAHDKGMEFHYPWLLILNAFVAWEEPEDTQFLGLRGKPCLVGKYQNF
jgi:hypothetical protein